MYNIDWSKYLSPNRFRDSGTGVGKDNDHRSQFDSDLGRVIFCPAIRRMHDKTQVVPLTSGDTVLTRLTHSLQVMNVAESLASNYTRSTEFFDMYGEKAVEYGHSISAILRTASLLHDIGNPPFGHFGEVTIQHYFQNPDICRHIDYTKVDHWNDFTQFDGNAMGLRIMSKLQYTGTLDGLNLSYGTMGAYLKYPNKGAADSDGYVGNHKHGIFKTEEELFDEIVKHCNMQKDDGTIKRHPLSFLVEAADSICYGAMDIEDGYSMGWYSFDHLLTRLSTYAYAKMDDDTKAEPRVQEAMVDVNGTKVFSIAKFLGFYPDCKDGTPKEKRRLILDFRVRLIDYLVKHATSKFIEKLDKIDEGTYDNELLKDDKFHINDALSKFTYNYIISQPLVQSQEIKGNSVICGLMDILIRYAFHENEKYRAKVKGVISEARLECAIHENSYPEEMFFKRNEHTIFDYDLGKLNTYARLRLIVDFISSMTDEYSIKLYQKLNGMAL